MTVLADHRFVSGAPVFCIAVVVGLLFAPSLVAAQERAEREAPAREESSPETEEERPPATHATWGVGVQFLPVLGLSVRWAPTPFFTLQAAGTPGVGGSFQGTIGGRVLIKFVRQAGYNVYGSVGAAPFFERTVEFGDDLSAERTTKTLWYTTATVGAEAALGSHFGLSGELGVGRLWDPEGSGFTAPAFGLGLHYYW